MKVNYQIKDLLRFLLVGHTVPLLVLLTFLQSCKSTDQTTRSPVEIAFDSSLQIEAIPASLGSSYANNFDRYTKVTTPNEGAIHIVAQSNISNEQIVRCRSILEHFLKDYPGSTHGSDKSAIANKMAENGAVLTLLNGKDDGKNSVEVDGQPLFEEEIQVEGHSWYTNQNYEHRDAAYEEILHLVHDFGIGVGGPNSSPGGAPEFQAQIRIAQENALDNKLWGMGAEDWISELSQENSLSQEYLAALIDAYYGLWGAWTESTTHSMWGIYVAKDRVEIASEDPSGQELLNNVFFHPYLTYNARIDQNFEGTFSLQFDPSIPYSNHSRYLKKITLLGANDTNVRVNQLDNNITGNEGINTVIFSGFSTDYSVSTADGATTITDNLANRDGVNTIQKFEKIQFTDQTIKL